jgi:hypothetical protein
MLTNGARRFSVQHIFFARSWLGQRKIVLNGYVRFTIEEWSNFDDSVWGRCTMHGFAAVCTLPLNEYVMSQN